MSVKCIGNNSNGQLGQGDTSNRGNSPLHTMNTYSAINLGTGTLKINTVNTGYKYTCAVLVDFTVKCFGSGSNGELGSEF